MNLKKILFTLIASLLLYYVTTSQKDNAITTSNKKNETSQEFDFLPSSTTDKIVKHDYFSLSYHEDYEQAEWVAYALKATKINNTTFKRPFFIQDPKVLTSSADWHNYKKSGYDKGHLCPAGDMKFSIEAYNDTFFTSNISPQKHSFNSGVWQRLEDKTRYWASRYGTIYVVTAGILNKDLETIGQEKVAVPKYFYKILFYHAAEKSKMIAFLMPHTKSDAPLYSFVTSVDSIEKLTGIDFFPKLKDDLEKGLEKSGDYKNWSF
jgi:endonuclease G